MYGMTNDGNIFADDITNWLIDMKGLKKNTIIYTTSMHYMDPI